MLGDQAFIFLGPGADRTNQADSPLLQSPASDGLGSLAFTSPHCRDGLQPCPGSPQVLCKFGLVLFLL